LFFEFRLQAFQCLFNNRTTQLFLLFPREVRIANRINDFLAGKYPRGTDHLSDGGDRTEMDRRDADSLDLVPQVEVRMTPETSSTLSSWAIFSPRLFITITMFATPVVL
jgi:hypothetical protein